MEDVRKVARAAYVNFSDEEKREMESTFRSMDKDGDGKISPCEFTAHSDRYTQNFFRLLDENGDGFLQFEEFLTLSYIIACGWPFCAACKGFIPGIFFTCTQCRLSHKTPPSSYDLCVDCYLGGKSEHHHADFDDNYTLLLELSFPQQPRPSRSGISSPTLSKENPSDQLGSRRRQRMKARIKKASHKIKSGVCSTLGTVAVGLSIYQSVDDISHGSHAL